MSSPEEPWDRLWYHATLATMAEDGGAYGLVQDGALATRGDRIVWVGATGDLPGEVATLARHPRDCAGRLVTPGLVDCHTHLVFAGSRAREFEMRLNGASYQAIAEAGGGINATVNATRAASEEDLVTAAAKRLDRLMTDGVTTVEIKSGYGLSSADEEKMLRAARRLAALMPVTVTTTFLGAHALPPEYAGRHDAYIDLVCEEMLPSVAAQGLADAVDAFCEGIAFDVPQTEKVFDKAAALGLPVKLHAEQLSDLGGAVMAARRGALSVDHLEYLRPADAGVLAEHGTVAVLLPGAFFCLRERQLPPVEALREAGVPIAISSDANPGSSPVGSLLLMLGMACIAFRLTPEEALAGVTRHAARALGLDTEVGTLETGKRADVVLWDVGEPAELSYRLGDLPCLAVLYGGEPR